MLLFSFPQAALRVVPCKLLNKLNKLDVPKDVSKIKAVEHHTRLSMKTI